MDYTEQAEAAIARAVRLEVKASGRYDGSGAAEWGADTDELFDRVLRVLAASDSAEEKLRALNDIRESAIEQMTDCAIRANGERVAESLRAHERDLAERARRAGAA